MPVSEQIAQKPAVRPIDSDQTGAGPRRSLTISRDTGPASGARWPGSSVDCNFLVRPASGQGGRENPFAMDISGVRDVAYLVCYVRGAEARSIAQKAKSARDQDIRDRNRG